MKPEEAIGLLQHPGLGGSVVSTWADLGAGTGVFTTVLASVLARGSTVYAVDNNARSLEQVPSSSTVTIKTLRADFTSMDWKGPLLDGILMANSLHYVNDKYSVIRKLQSWLLPEGCFVLVEYDMDKANPWVPFPLPFSSMRALFGRAGYTSIERISTLPSIYNRSLIYSALIRK